MYPTCKFKSNFTVYFIEVLANILPIWMLFTNNDTRNKVGAGKSLQFPGATINFPATGFQNLLKNKNLIWAHLSDGSVHPSPRAAAPWVSDDLYHPCHSAAALWVSSAEDWTHLLSGLWWKNWVTCGLAEGGICASFSLISSFLLLWRCL